MNKKKKTTIDLPGMGEYARMLYLGNLIREPAILSAIRSLNLPENSCGLDVGCGIGLHAVLLAEEVGAGGHVTGLDLSKEFLKHATKLVKDSHLSERIDFKKGNVCQLPFEDASFDWVWSTDTLWPGPKWKGYPAESPMPMVKELVRVVKPGGTIAVVFWSSQKLLPGYPVLEAWLSTTPEATAPLEENSDPGLHCLRARKWLVDAGLVDVRADTFVADVQAPLDDNIREALAAIMHMFWGKAKSYVSKKDWMEFKRLCLPDSPDCILDEPDYYAFLTYSMFHGTVPVR